MLPCTSRNNIQALVLAGAARGALQSRVPARVPSPRPPYGFSAATARVEAAKGAGGGKEKGAGGSPPSSARPTGAGDADDGGAAALPGADLGASASQLRQTMEMSPPVKLKSKKKGKKD